MVGVARAGFEVAAGPDASGRVEGSIEVAAATAGVVPTFLAIVAFQSESISLGPIRRSASRFGP